MTQALSEAPVGVALQLKINGKLFDAHRSHKSLRLLVKDLQFADAALVSDCEAGLQQIIDRLTDTESAWGFTLSRPKTKIMCCLIGKDLP